MTFPEAATAIEPRDRAVLVRLLVPDLDARHTQAVETDIREAAVRFAALPFILDMSKVKFLPSISLGAVARLAGAFKARNHRLILAGMQPGVRDVVATTRLDRMFEVHDDVESALRAVQP